MQALSAGQVNIKRVAVIIGLGVVVLIVAWLIGRRSDSDPIDPVQREFARIESLEKKKDIAALSDVTHNSNLDIACRAVGALARARGRDDGLVYLTEVLGDERDRVRESASRDYGDLALSGRKWFQVPSQEVAPLVKAMQDPAPGVRAGAARSLGRLQAWDGVEPLLTALDDTDLAVRRSAMDAMKEVNQLDFKFMYNPEDPPAKRQAAQQQIRKMLPKLKHVYDRYVTQLKGKTP